jgi:hypothetical protein
MAMVAAMLGVILNLKSILMDIQRTRKYGQ